ncbi:ASKHA domain-containing protein [Geobacter sp. AOG2]|uniref:ASKHA domain-containing protein n=1 Tax=Geobacter sp. AOG2 TaxID=1566347 RepID=UPI001CC54DE3|nr:ASKHA domain-containing protein [Geobacter sp. AOG2]GFE62727.1 hypothetical protein AOG2_33150 [Geobacter sp. AOG2]
MPDYALAMDLGTTTLAASLIDRATGKRLAMTGSMNPQRRFGADVVSRLDAAVHSEEAQQEMAALIRTELLRLAHELCAESGVPWGGVKQAAIAGNPAMQHLLLGLPVKSLAFPPYRPLFTGGKPVTAAELGWDGAAQVYLFPMPGGFVGGDTVAFLYGAAPGEATLCLDMGTNGEMALTSGDTIWATSAAAGPAFEGGNLSCGMAALPGAVNSIRIEGERVKIATIAGREPVGICGSAAIELVTELLGHGVLEAGGRLRSADEIPSNLGQRVVEQDGERAFVIHRDARRLLLLTQRDIRQIQLAKGAIRAGMEVLAERSGIAFPGLRDVLLTGSFGAVLRPIWLKTIGIFDEGMVHISRFTPEGALAGVERALAENDGFASVERLGKRFRVVPLSGTPLFESMFMRHIDFPG